MHKRFRRAILAAMGVAAIVGTGIGVTSASNASEEPGVPATPHGDLTPAIPEGEYVPGTEGGELTPAIPSDDTDTSPPEPSSS